MHLFSNVLLLFTYKYFKTQNSANQNQICQNIKILSVQVLLRTILFVECTCIVNQSTF